MLTVDEALAEVLKHARSLPADSEELESAIRRVLAEDIACDVDSPPYDKALMDGYAVRSADLAGGGAALEVVEEITAGRMPTRPVKPGQVARIMTGAPVPAGADAVVMVERTRLLDGGKVQVDDRPPRPGQNILPRGREMRSGEVVLKAGAVLRPQEIGLLALVGRTEVRVIPRPGVGVLCTGDEIVAPSKTPGPGQIRNSNGPMLVAQSTRAWAFARFLGIARDEIGPLRHLIEEGLDDDVLVLSGGVSAGKLDLVPGVLQELGVEAHFHKVEMKPGKPLFFGTRPRPEHPCPTLVFGLPGNPVSSFVGFELFVRPALRKLLGHNEPGPQWVELELTADFPYRTDRPTYHPAEVTPGERGWEVRLIEWFGSPDLRALCRANALALLPPGDHVHRAGQLLPVLWLDVP